MQIFIKMKIFLIAMRKKYNKQGQTDKYFLWTCLVSRLKRMREPVVLGKLFLQAPSEMMTEQSFMR